ncbi:hypothetical protein KP509_31G057900 [Ceratopteris richardii]|uniref:Nudix hydrolase domain-containing protein n=2 Tax=Ceratopteris richardii TaxID=49495 RepID=A0A8T2R062_CERRI|nr:hypothetical protein KP509_31G057900 [Ceratopteris richardii]
MNLWNHRALLWQLASESTQLNVLNSYSWRRAMAGLVLARVCGVPFVLMHPAPCFRMPNMSMSRLSALSGFQTLFIGPGQCMFPPPVVLPPCTSVQSVSPPAESTTSTSIYRVIGPKVSFCSKCGGPTEHCIPDGEERLRAICKSCGIVHYQNPKMVVGCVVAHEDKVLLCRRSIEPSYGLWTLPAGYLELGESAAEGAVRETWEEAIAAVDIEAPFALLDIPRIGLVYASL